MLLGRDDWVALLALAVLIGGCSGSETPATSEGGEESTAESGTEEATGGEVPPTCEGVFCDDGNPCTDDSCADGVCSNALLVGESCDDGNACTDQDACDEKGACTGDVSVICEDENPCTVASCDPGEGCRFDPAEDGATCNDGNACSLADVCTAGECAGQLKTCEDDGNGCTVNAGCSTTTGECLHETVADASPCDDGNLCTTEDACVGNACVGGPALACTDENGCTDDSCTPKGGCVFSPNQAFCDDADACTVQDTCGQGKCLGEKLDCNDENECTDDTCDGATGCVQVALTKPCQDGNACTTGDTCVDGECASGDSKTCDDNNACTDDLCDLASGDCQFTPNEAACDDGSLCTSSDGCGLGNCGGTPIACDDGSPCTGTSCAAQTGCLFEPVDAACDDGNPCTLDDACSLGACAAGAPKTCDDGNACTTDQCDAQSGDCAHEVNVDPCDDGDACTALDLCAAGVCAGDPIAVESIVCDGLDEDCDGSIDEDCTLVLRGRILGDGATPSTEAGGFLLTGRIGTPRVVGTTETDVWRLQSGLPTPQKGEDE